MAEHREEPQRHEKAVDAHFGWPHAAGVPWTTAAVVREPANARGELSRAENDVPKPNRQVSSLLVRSLPRVQLWGLFVEPPLESSVHSASACCWCCCCCSHSHRFITTASSKVGMCLPGGTAHERPLCARGQRQWAIIVPIIFLEFLVISMSRTIIPELIDEKYGASSYVVYGSADGARGLLAFLATPAFGALSDELGRKWLFLVTVVGTSSPIIVLALCRARGSNARTHGTEVH